MVKVTFRDKEWEVRGNMTVRRIITKLGLNPETVLAVRDGELINDGTKLGESDEIKLIAVISGGDS